MLRVFGVVLLAAVAVPAAVASGPQSLRLARPADVSPSAGSPNENWQLLAVDGRRRSSLLLRIDWLRGGGTVNLTSAELTYWPTVPQSGIEETFSDLGTEPTAGPGVAVRGISITYRAGRWTLALDQGPRRVRLVLTNTRPGVTATRWPIGEVGSPPQWLATFDWS